MSASPAFEKLEWSLDHKSAWSAVRVLAMGGRGFGQTLPAELLEAWSREASRRDAQLEGVRVFSQGKGVSVSFYDASGKRTGSSPVRVVSKGGKGWPDGELGAVLEEFHRLVPLSGMWSWRAGSAAQSVFPLAEPTAWPLLLSMSLLSPLVRILPTLGKAPNILVTGFGFVEDRMELCFQRPRDLPDHTLAAAAAAAGAGNGANKK